MTAARPAADLCIGLLLPDVLGTYSDRGNAEVLAQRARWRGISATVVEAPASSVPPASCDVYVLGGGENAAQAFGAEWLARHGELRAALARTQLVAVCAGLQLIGREIIDEHGRRQPGAGLVDVTTTLGRHRAIGEIVVSRDEPGAAPLTGFENHSGRTTLGAGVAPLGRVLRGTGNGDGTDGVLTDTVVGTYLHGPVLARNPDLADLVLHRATGAVLAPLDVPDEDAARELHLAGTAARRRRPRRAAAVVFGRTGRER